MRYFKKSKNEGERLYDAINTSNTQLASKLIEEGANVNYTSPSNEKKSLLMLAMEKNMEDVFKTLVKKGANLEFKDSNGNTVLNLLSQDEDSNFKMVNILFDNKANINTRNNFGETPLMHFSSYISDDYVKRVDNVLETMEPDLNIRDNNEHTALYYAAYNKQPDNLILLLKYIKKRSKDMKDTIDYTLRMSPNDLKPEPGSTNTFTDAFLNVDADFFEILYFSIKTNNEDMFDYLIDYANKKSINIFENKFYGGNILSVALEKNDLNIQILEKILNLADKEIIFEELDDLMILDYDPVKMTLNYDPVKISILLDHLEKKDIKIENINILKKACFYLSDSSLIRRIYRLTDKNSLKNNDIRLQFTNQSVRPLISQINQQIKQLKNLHKINNRYNYKIQL